MKKILKYLFVIIVVAILGLLSYLKFMLPNVGPPLDIKVEITQERIKRGEYLANHVFVCMDCHSTRNYGLYTAPLVPGTLGKGGELFDQKFGFPGIFYSKNITPLGIGDWTDGEIFRAITTGVTKHGTTIFPVMPYTYYGKADSEDVKDVIAYVRSLKPIENKVPDHSPDFPMNFILNTIPQKASLQPRPSSTDTVATGKYLVYVAGCFECHTKPDDKGQKIPGMDFAGGWEFKLGDGRITTTANITPDNETGIGLYTKQAFIDRFKVYADSTNKPYPVGKGENQSIMPWTMYAGMSTDDLAAIYSYLKTIKPIKNKIEKFRKNTKVASK